MSLAKLLRLCRGQSWRLPADTNIVCCDYVETRMAGGRGLVLVLHVKCTPAAAGRVQYIH